MVIMSDVSDLAVHSDMNAGCCCPGPKKRPKPLDVEQLAISEAVFPVPDQTLTGFPARRHLREDLSVKCSSFSICSKLGDRQTLLESPWNMHRVSPLLCRDFKPISFFFGALVLIPCFA